MDLWAKRMVKLMYQQLILGLSGGGFSSKRIKVNICLGI